MLNGFGSYIRKRREDKYLTDPEYSLRKTAAKIGVQPAYLSKVEREEGSPPSEKTILKIAAILGEDPDILLALAGKVSSELQKVIIKRPELFAELIRRLKDEPDHAVLRIVREVRDGNW